MSNPIFRHGQHVKVNGKEFVVPYRSYYIDTKKDWDEINFYGKMASDEFVVRKLKDAINDYCILCETGIHSQEPCFQYVLLEVDEFGFPTGEIDTHVCETTIKLSKKFSNVVKI